MYPRLNPKSNKYNPKPKNSLNILTDNRYRDKTPKNIQNINPIEYQKKSNNSRVQSIADISKTPQRQQRFNKFFAKQNHRHSVCLNQLPQKFNHLRGKRRSLQLALQLYQQIEEQKKQKRFHQIESSKGRNFSFRKLSHDLNRKKNYFSKINLINYLQNEHPQKVLKYNSQYITEGEIQNSQQPLREKNSISTNKQQNEYPENYEYNFISKPMRKKSFFKNRIMEQILENNIDKWQNEEKNEQTDINLIN